MALSHLKDALENSDNTTLGIDGNSKFGHHYGTSCVTTNDEFCVIGMKEMEHGTAEAYFDVVIVMMEDIAGFGADKEQNAAEIILKVKSTISYQASTNKMLNTLPETWREELAPTVVDSWDEMSDDEKHKVMSTSLTNFWCALHVLVGLSDQANKTIDLWENLVHKMQNVGFPATVERYRKAGESGTASVVRTFAKLCRI